MRKNRGIAYTLAYAEIAADGVGTFTEAQDKVIQAALELGAARIQMPDSTVIVADRKKLRLATEHWQDSRNKSPCGCGSGCARCNYTGFKT